MVNILCMAVFMLFHFLLCKEEVGSGFKLWFPRYNIAEISLSCPAITNNIERMQLHCISLTYNTIINYVIAITLILTDPKTFCGVLGDENAEHFLFWVLCRTIVICKFAYYIQQVIDWSSEIQI